MEKTNFYQLLIKARHDEATLVSVIDKIMPMINKNCYAYIWISIIFYTLHYYWWKCK